MVGSPFLLAISTLQVAGCNLELLLRQMIGVGTFRSLQGRPAALFRAVFRRFHDLWDVLRRSWALFLPHSPRTPSSRRDQSIHSTSWV